MNAEVQRFVKEGNNERTLQHGALVKTPHVILGYTKRNL